MSEEETRSFDLTKDELITLIGKTFIPYSKIDLVKGWITFDREGPIWDGNKLRELDFDKLIVLYLTVRKWSWQTE